jgi:carboxymethylenebutenolidase
MNPTWGSYAGKAALIHCDEEDGLSAAEGIQTAISAIEAAGGTVEVHDYPGTSHAFFNDERPEVHDSDASEEAWERTVTFLHEHLG